MAPVIRRLTSLLATALLSACAGLPQVQSLDDGPLPAYGGGYGASLDLLAAAGLTLPIAGFTVLPDNSSECEQVEDCKAEEYACYCKPGDGVCTGLPPVTWTQGVAITPIQTTAAIECGNPTFVAPISYACSGYPTGIATSTSTGQGTGTPTVTGSFTATCSGTNAKGSVQLNRAVTVLAPAPTADIFYVAAGASPGTAGTTGAPFNLIADCNAIMNAGDTCRIRTGQYPNDPIRPATSGTAGNLITYEADTGAVVTLTNVNEAIDLDDRAFIRVRTTGFTVTGGEGVAYPNRTINEWISLSNTTDSIIDGTGSFKFANGYSCVQITGTAARNVIREGYFQDCGSENPGGGTTYGDMFDFDALTTLNVLERVTAYYSGHLMFDLDGTRNVIQKNLFDNKRPSGTGGSCGAMTNKNVLDAPTGSENLLQLNTCAGAGMAGGQNVIRGHGFEVRGVRQIARWNSMVDQGIIPIKLVTITGEQNTFSNRIYQNTINGWQADPGNNSRIGLVQAGSGTPAYDLYDNELLNNAYTGISGQIDVTPEIVYSINTAALEAGQPWNNNRIKCNSFANVGIDVNDTLQGLGVATIGAREASYPSVFSGNAVNVSGGFQADTGCNLTTVASSNGSGTTFAVNDSYGFFPGWGVITGDSIKVGTQNCVTVTAINHTTEQITVASSISWTTGMAVNQCYAGAGPDRGIESNLAVGDPDPSPPPVDTTPPSPPTSFVSRCVSVTGNDTTNTGSCGNNGETYSPWRTISKVNSSVSATGMDVYLKAGEQWDNEVLTVDWNGTVSDRVVIGTYYLSGGQALQSLPADASLNPKLRSYPNGRATISGSYKPACRVWTSTCLFDTAGAVPSSRWGGLVNINGYDYVTIQNLIVRDSAGYGIVVNGTGFPCYGGNAACQDYSEIKDNLVSHTATTGIGVQQTGHSVVSGNEIEFQGIVKVDKVSAVVNAGGGYGAALIVIRCDPCNSLVENNYVHDIYGEGMSSFAASFVLYRGNWSANQARSPAYMDGSDNIVTEQNIFAGGTVARETNLGDPGFNPAAAFYTMAEIKEPSAGSGGSSANQIRKMGFRNNLTANYLNCFRIGLTGAGDTTALVSGFFVGNTCIGASGETATSSGAPQSQTDSLGFQVQNNIFATTTGAPTCDYTTNSLIPVNRNYWTTTPSDNDCKGAGDTYSTYAALGLGAFNFATASVASFPASTNFEIPITSGAASGGVALTSTYYTEADWSWILSQRTWKPTCQSAQVALSEFVKVLSTDYCGDPRTPLSRGALNRNP